MSRPGTSASDSSISSRSRESLRDLDEMLLSDVEVPGRLMRFEVQLQLGEHSVRAAVELLGVDDAGAARLTSKEDVLRDRELRYQRQLLMNDRNAGPFGCSN